MDLFGLLVSFQGTGSYLALLLFFAWYPMVTSVMWIYTSIIFFKRREDIKPEKLDKFYAMTDNPFVSFLVPAYNEEQNIASTIEGLLKVQYPNFEIVIVDDCSTDNTLELIHPYLQNPRVRLVRKLVNEGKAMALNDAIPVTKGELIFVMDADAVPVPDILDYLVPHFRWPRCAAVTGNPRVANRDSLLAKLQTIEFASIISLMRRAQRIWGRIMTMSGVVGIFRRSALYDVGLYTADMATEDIDLTWRLQLRHWDVRYESRAVMWMRVPQSLRGLWHQRKRWALGLSQVLCRHAKEVLRWQNRRFWPVMIEAHLSVLWAYTYILLTIIWFLSYAVGYPPVGASPIPNFWGMLIASVCLAQLYTGVVLDKNYDPTLPKFYIVAIFYPLVYWILMAVITVTTAPKGLSVNRQRTKVTRWKTVRE